MMRIAPIACAGMLASVLVASQHTTPHIVRPADLKWQSIAGYPPGYERAELEGRTDSHGPVTYRTRLPPHFRFEPHTHTWDEHVTVLSGTWYLGFGTRFDETRMERLEAGSFAVIPGGVSHYVMTGDEETMLQAHGTGPVGLKFVHQ